eukprot:Skav215810  [mRNA]  locus=scaffold3885:185871:186969:+ [translate_table: standard]
MFGSKLTKSFLHVVSFIGPLRSWTRGTLKRRYCQGELYDGKLYNNGYVGELHTYGFKATDGSVKVWRHAFDLRAFGKEGPKNCKQPAFV